MDVVGSGAVAATETEPPLRRASSASKLLASSPCSGDENASIYFHEAQDAILFDATQAPAVAATKATLMLQPSFKRSHSLPSSFEGERPEMDDGHEATDGDDDVKEAPSSAAGDRYEEEEDELRGPDTNGEACRGEHDGTPSVMNFDAFVTGSLSSTRCGETTDGNRTDSGGDLGSCTLTAEDDDDADNDRGNSLEVDSEDHDRTPMEKRSSSSSLRALSSMRSAAAAASVAKLVLVKEKTQQVAQTQKQALSNFQKKGGLVGWLHGGPDGFSDEDDSSEEDQAERAEDEKEVQAAPHPALPRGSSSEPNKEALRSASLSSDSMSSPPHSPRQHQSFPTHQQVPAPSTSSPTSFLKSSLGRQRAGSLLENLYGKMKGTAATPPTTPPRGECRGSGGRIALQPSPRKENGSSDPCSIGFDGFAAASDDVGTSKAKVGRDPRQRAVSAESSFPSSARPLPKARLPFPSLSPSPSSEPSSPRKNEPKHLPLDECLADPKLAAEFVTTVLPDDAALLKLLYSIEEYEALVTTEPIPALSVQVTYATTVIDKFLSRSATASTPESGRRTSCSSSPLLSRQLPESAVLELKHTMEQSHLANATALPKSLFRDVHDVVYMVLRDGYEAFKHTREYAHLLDQQQQQQGRTIGAVMTMDAILANEWYCTVFWMHLYRTSHHHRLSFLMDKAFKLDKLYHRYLEATQTESTARMAAETDRGTCEQHHHLPERAVAESYERLVGQLKLLSRKFLQKSAPVALPVTAAPLCRLKEEICIEIAHLGDAAAIERVMGKLDAFSFDVQKEFKRLSFERFASFTASALYRDFISSVPPPSEVRLSEGSMRGDIVQLLRASRISFHQAPNEVPQVHNLSSLCCVDDSSATQVVVSDDAICKVFAFAKRGVVDTQKRMQPYEYVDLLESTSNSNNSTGESGDGSGTTRDALLYQTIEHFLVPEASPRTFQITDAEAQQSVCFNFVAGNGGNVVYGAVWRMPLVHSGGITTQGICILSKYPLVDSLRRYLRCFAESRRQLDSTPSDSGSTIPAGTMLRDLDKHPFDEAKAAFDRYFAMRHRHVPVKSDADSGVQDLPSVDFSLEDLFDCLSITHILRLVAFVLLEKKIVLVSSSYSVLLTVGEALKSLIYPLVWSHIYVPVLPLALKGYLHCPTPFIFGLHNSYVRSSELPRSSDDLVVVNLDRDSLTGGGDVFLPPTRNASIRDKLTKICKPRLQHRDQIDYADSDPTNHAPLEAQQTNGVAGTATTVTEFPSEAIRSVFHEELRDILSGLETFAFRFASNDKFVTVVDSSNKSRAWTSDSSRFHATLLQTQAFSAHLSSLRHL